MLAIDRRYMSRPEPRGRRSAMRSLMAGTVFSGALLLGAGGFYFSGSGAALADCYTQSGTTYTFSGNTCTQDIPSPGALYSSTSTLTWNFENGANITLTDGPFYVGSPGSAAGLGAGNQANMYVNVQNSGTVLTMGNGVPIYIGYSGASNAGTGYFHVTHSGRLVFNDITVSGGNYGYTDSNGRSYSNVGLQFDDNAIGDGSGQLLVQNGSTLVVSGSGSKVTSASLQALNDGNIVVDSNASLQVNGALLVADGTMVVSGGAQVTPQSAIFGDGSGNSATLVLSSGGIFVGSLNLGSNGGNGTIVIGDPDNLYSPQYGPGNFAKDYGIINGSGIIKINHNLNINEKFVLYASRDNFSKIDIDVYSGYTVIKQEAGGYATPYDVNIYGVSIAWQHDRSDNIIVNGGSLYIFENAQNVNVNVNSGYLYVGFSKIESGLTFTQNTLYIYEDLKTSNTSQSYVYFNENTYY